MEARFPSVNHNGTQDAASFWTTRWTPHGAIARVWGPLSMANPSWLSGAMAVHPQWRERSRPLIASSALSVPSLTGFVANLAQEVEKGQLPLSVEG